MYRLAALLTLLLFAAPSIAGDPRTGLVGISMENVEEGLGYDAVVDITGTTNPCSTIQSAINPFAVGTDKQRSIKVVGKATVDFADTTPIKYWNGAAVANGPYRVCWNIAPSRGVNGGESSGYPIVDGSYINGGWDGESLYIEWDVELDYDSTGQNDVVVFGNEGAGFMVGTDGGYVLDGVEQAGRIRLEFKTDTDGGTVAGAVPVMTSADLFADAETTVGFFRNGLYRGSDVRLVRQVIGKSGDNDDIGLVHRFTWGVRYGGLLAHSLNVGAVVYGSSASTLDDSYISGNNIGLMLGADNTVAGDVVFFSGCTSGACVTIDEMVSGFSISDTVIEGNSYGQVIINDAQKNTFQDVHMESGNVLGHQLLLAGGTCSDNNRPCGSDAECASVSCEVNANVYLRDIRFVGGESPDDNGDATFEGIYVGEGAGQLDGAGDVHIANMVYAGASNYAFGWDAAAATGAGLGINLDRAHFNGSVFPPYPFLASDNVELVTLWSMDTAFTAGNCVRQIEADVSDTSCASVQTQWIPPAGSAYQVHKLTIHPLTGAANTVACDAQVGLAAAIGGAPSFGGTPIQFYSASCDGTGEFCSTYPNFSLDEDDALALRFNSPSTQFCVAGAGCVCNDTRYRAQIELIRLPEHRD